MKKLIFLLLVSVVSYGQAEFPEGIQLGGNGPTISTNKIISQDSNGNLNYLPASGFPISTATEAALDLKVSKTGEGFNYTIDFDDILSQNSSLTIGKRALKPESTRLPVANTTILGWGDSLTAGAGGSGTTYETVLSGLTTFTVTNKGVGGETSTQIKDRLIADTGNYDKTVIIWAGRNNYSDPATVKADIATMVATLTHTRFLIMGVTNGEYSYEYSGAAGHTLITQLNSDLKAIYGNKFLDIRSYLISLHDNSAQDLIDFGHDIVPSSLRSDPVHLNALGYTKVGELINRYLGVLFEKEEYLQSKDFAYYNNLYNSGTSILNQSSVDQTANFRITGSGIFNGGVITRNGLSAAHHVLQNGASNRWSFGLNGAESTGALGSNFQLSGYSNAGSSLVIPFYIFRNGHVVIKDTGSVPSDPNFNFTVFGSTWANSLYLGTSPTTSAGGYEFLTRNTSSGITEKIPSANVQGTIVATTSADYYRGDKTMQPLNGAVIGSVLTGFSAVSGIVSPTDTVLQGFNKLAGNQALKADLTDINIQKVINATDKDATIDTNSNITLFGGTADNRTISATTADASGSNYSTYEQDNSKSSLTNEISGGDSASIRAWNGLIYMGQTNAGVGTTQIGADDAIANTTTNFQALPAGNYKVSVAKTYSDATTVVKNSATLTTDYPAALPGDKVHALSIIAGALIYEKTASGWAQYPVTVTP